MGANIPCKPCPCPKGPESGCQHADSCYLKSFDTKEVVCNCRYEMEQTYYNRYFSQFSYFISHLMHYFFYLFSMSEKLMKLKNLGKDMLVNDATLAMSITGEHQMRSEVRANVASVTVILTTV